MRERLFRQKTPEEGKGWTVNSKAGWIVLSVGILVLLVAMILSDQMIEDRVIRVMVSVSVVMLWAAGFTLFAKWESERP